MVPGMLHCGGGNAFDQLEHADLRWSNGSNRGRQPSRGPPPCSAKPDETPAALALIRSTRNRPGGDETKASSFARRSWTKWTPVLISQVVPVQEVVASALG